MGVINCLFLNFPVSSARPKILCDFYWLQLHITRKLGWVEHKQTKATE